MRQTGAPIAAADTFSAAEEAERTSEAACARSFVGEPAAGTPGAQQQQQWHQDTMLKQST
jgi:hypothetical protein